MGTRADFYLGRDRRAEWVGSIAGDGYRSGIPDDVLCATDPESYRSAVSRFLKSRDDAIFPEQGWPWPWNDSALTDCSYWFFDGQVWEEKADRHVPHGFPFEERNRAIVDDYPLIQYPDMSRRRKKVRLDKGSGLIFIGKPRS